MKERCERCGGEIIFKPFTPSGIRKPALRGKWACKACGFWPLANVTHGTPNKSLEQTGQSRDPKQKN